MRHGSLFSGIGGFDLAAEWVGWTNVFQVEIDKYCQKVLTKNFPSVTRYEDIKKFDGKKYTGKVDIISGGFPCQPFSHAGKRKGNEDDRALWPEMLRVIQEIRPIWIVGENVAGILSMDNGKTFEQICASLENEGYTVQSYIIPACGVGAWHRRNRVWIIANTNGRRKETKRCEISGAHEKIQERDNNPKLNSTGQYGTNTNTNNSGDRNGLRTNGDGETQDEGREGFAQLEFGEGGGESSTRETPSNTNNKRLQGEWELGTDEERENSERYFRQDCRTWKYWAIEPAVGRVANGVPNRMDRIKGLGNAIVPQVAIQIFKAIEAFESG